MAALQPVFTWEAAVVIAYIALWNLGLYLFNTRNPLWRRCSHVSLVLIANKKQDCEGPPQTWFAWDHVSPKDLVSSPFGVLTLAFLRAFQLCVFIFTNVYGNILYTPAGGHFFIYFTNWTFVLFGLTALLGTALTVKEWLKRRRPTIPCIEPATKSVSSSHSWSVPLASYQLLLTTTCSASIMLTIFYWFADYVPGSELRFDNPIKHGASSLLLLLDVAMSRMPLVSYHVQVVIVYGTVYLAFLWAYYGGTGTWVYRALDWTKFMAVPYYFALPVLLLLGFSITLGVASLRELLVNNCTCSCGSSSSRRKGNDPMYGTAKQPHSSWAQRNDNAVLTAVPADPSLPASPRLAITLQ